MPAELVGYCDLCSVCLAICDRISIKAGKLVIESCLECGNCTKACPLGSLKLR